MFGPEVLTAVSFALVAGVATFFSPCAYALLPGYVGFYATQTEEPTLRGTVVRGGIAATGIVLTLAVLLGVAFWLGQQAVEGLLIVEPLVGVALVAFGVIVLAGKAPSLSVTLPQRRSSVLGFGIFGAGYAVAAAGCVAPIFLTVVVQSLAFPPTEGAIILGTYVASIALLMLALTVATGMGLLAGAGRLAAYSHRLEQLAGAVMIVAGLGQLYVAYVNPDPDPASLLDGGTETATLVLDVALTVTATLG
ncbi:cytochrome c biogenesis CcdA family protein [Natrarchaeobaculum aegyptiacum]|uniref:Cytochrome C biogenesis protein n=1 Tax=Natrarchaeobaculum aegyptiacum TaxID=745377 RepID=A0A2Z2HXS4_9EURY|nr:cytochrome c biogenesis protein CcdA [Natrarchaeobaculum aegyptiacum]ARS91065.1 cytochrome C biogenesis protein [Natrarchaeobaculum aegyptiacum]